MLTEFPTEDHHQCLGTNCVTMCVIAAVRILRKRDLLLTVCWSCLRGDRGLDRDALGGVQHILRLLGFLPQLRQRLPDVVDALQRVVRALHTLRRAHQHGAQDDPLPGLDVAHAVLEENLQERNQARLGHGPAEINKCECTLRARKTYRLVRVDVGDPERLLHGVHVGLAEDRGLGQLVGGAAACEVAGDVEDLGLPVARRARRVQGLEADDPLEAVLQAQPLEGAHGVNHVAVREYLKNQQHMDQDQFRLAGRRRVFRDLKKNEILDDRLLAKRIIKEEAKAQIWGCSLLTSWPRETLVLFHDLRRD
jgi:hypothetical protein